MSTWIPVAHKSEVRQHKQFVCIAITEIDHVAVCNIDGEVHAFDNRCAHRGAHIYKLGCGIAEPACPYHGRAIDKSRKYAHKIVGGFVFVSVPPGLFGEHISWSNDDDKALDLIEEQFSPFLTDIPDLTFHSAYSNLYDCHWTVAVENALESEHVSKVHEQTLAKLGIYRDRMVTVGNGSSIEFFKSSEAKRLDRLIKSFKSSKPLDYVHAHFFPAAALSSTRGLTYSLQLYLPYSKTHTSVLSRLYVPTENLNQSTFLASAAVFNKHVFDEDAEVCRGIPFDFKGKLGPKDDRIKHFRKRVGVNLD